MDNLELCILVLVSAVLLDGLQDDGVAVGLVIPLLLVHLVERVVQAEVLPETVEEGNLQEHRALLGVPLRKVDSEQEICHLEDLFQVPTSDEFPVNRVQDDLQQVLVLNLEP